MSNNIPYLVALYLCSYFYQSPIGVVEYELILDLIANNEPEGRAILIFEDECSLFYYPDAPNHTSMREISSNVHSIIVGDSEGFPIYKDRSKNYITFKERWIPTPEKVRIEDTIPVFEWDIMQEQKMIDKYKCQKAETNFGGRTYDVWFTNEIAVSHGPHKFGGLPGLILEAKSSDGRVHFKFKSFQFVDKMNKRIEKPKEGKLFSSLSEFKIAMRAYINELNEQAFGSGTTFSLPYSSTRIEKIWDDD